MNIQEIEPRTSYFSVQIPEIKRHHSFLDPNFIFITDHSSLVPHSFEPLKNELQDHKPQLNLRPEKSSFTLVTASQDQRNDVQKNDKSGMAYLNECIQQYQAQLQKMSSIFIDQNLQEKREVKDQPLNTKNILRNICNAQNQYILFNAQAQAIVSSIFQNPERFKHWINKLRFHTFQQFQSVWSPGEKYKLYRNVYKKLCKKFYIQNAIPYIINSRIKNKQTKLAHLRFLYRFLEGIQNPASFYYFKLKDKQKQVS